MQDDGIGTLALEVAFIEIVLGGIGIECGIVPVCGVMCIELCRLDGGPRSIDPRVALRFWGEDACMRATAASDFAKVLKVQISAHFFERLSNEMCMSWIDGSPSAFESAQDVARMRFDIVGIPR